MNDMKDRDCYDAVRKSVPRPKNSLLLFVTWTQSWVGKPPFSWQDDWWYCQEVALLNNLRPDYGKHLMLFDREADMKKDFKNLRPKEFMLRTPAGLVYWARRRYDIQSVWYGNAGITATTSQCVSSGEFRVIVARIRDAYLRRAGR